MKIRVSKITFNLLSYLANKTRGNAFVVKYKLLIGTFLLSATQATAQDTVTTIKDDSNRIQEEEISCYKPMPTIYVKAKIVDKDNDPLIGVTVSINGKPLKENSAVSNEKGYFEIETLPNDILVFSYLGFETREIKAKAISQNATIVMQYSSQVMCYDVVIVKRKK